MDTTPRSNVLDYHELVRNKQCADMLGVTPAEYRRMKRQGHPDVDELERVLYRMDEGRL